MKTQYTQAFLEVMKEGMPVEIALSGLRATLEKKSHSKLLVPVLLEAVRVLEADKFVGNVVVKTARAADVTSLKTQIDVALTELGVTNDAIQKNLVDETLIGGFVATFDYKEHNKSYKKLLKSLYESITS